MLSLVQLDSPRRATLDSSAAVPEGTGGGDTTATRHDPAAAPIDVSIIVPTLNEALNLPPLLERIAAALPETSYEVLIVDDDSRDDTPSVCEALARIYPVRLIVRKEPKNGLSGAVLHGMAQARGTYLAVMDADLQHPPERLPALLAPLKAGEADFVLGSRYVEGGSTAEGWTLFRKLNSGIATFLARPFAGRTTDPMSGFFALRRRSYADARRLTPLGYKIALELMCKCRAHDVKEIPIHFGTRVRGESKLSLKQQFRYLEHLSRLYDFTYPRASPVVKFLVATAAGWITGLTAYLVFRRGGADAFTAVVAAYPIGLIVTTLFHARYIHTQREFINRSRPWLDFAVIAAAEWVACALAAAWVTRRVPAPSGVELLGIPFAAATLMRYVLRKEFMQDIRGLHRDARAEEMRPGA